MHVCVCSRPFSLLFLVLRHRFEQMKLFTDVFSHNELFINAKQFNICEFHQFLCFFLSFLFGSAPPKIVDITIESTNHGIVKENDQVILKCLVRGNPLPKILWIIPEIKSSLVNQRHERSKSSSNQRTRRKTRSFVFYFIRYNSIWK